MKFLIVSWNVRRLFLDVLEKSEMIKNNQVFPQNHTLDGKKIPPGGFLAIIRYHSIGEVPG